MKKNWLNIIKLLLAQKYSIYSNFYFRRSKIKIHNKNGGNTLIFYFEYFDTHIFDNVCWKI